MNRRCISREDAAVWCPGGRWGPRRTQVTECYSVFSAEDVYTACLKEDARHLAPGAAGAATFSVGGRHHAVRWEVRQNAVWRRGRMFLRCDGCERRSTRLYLPLDTSPPRCRKCWGLTYPSRTLCNYKDSIWGRGAFARMFGTTQREWALQCSTERREERRRASRQRWRERANLLAEPDGGHRRT